VESEDDFVDGDGEEGRGRLRGGVGGEGEEGEEEEWVETHDGHG
jgi:hypothetical protein